MLRILAWNNHSNKGWWQTWKRLSIGYPFQIPLRGYRSGASTIILKGRNAAGTPHNLYTGSDGVSRDGDLIQLGYYKTAANAANEDASNYNPHRGTWTLSPRRPRSGTNTIVPSTTKPANSTLTLFTQDTSGDGNADLAKTNNSSTSATKLTTTTLVTLLSVMMWLCWMPRQRQGSE